MFVKAMLLKGQNCLTFFFFKNQNKKVSTKGCTIVTIFRDGKVFLEQDLNIVDYKLIQICI